MVDISDFDNEELKMLILALQQRVMVESNLREMDKVEMKGLRAENEALKKVLADRIVGILVHPTAHRRPAEDVLIKTEEEKIEGNTADKTDTIDENEKDKFQA